MLVYSIHRLHAYLPHMGTFRVCIQTRSYPSYRYTQSIFTGVSTCCTITSGDTCLKRAYSDIVPTEDVLNIVQQNLFLGHLCHSKIDKLLLFIFAMIDFNVWTEEFKIKKNTYFCKEYDIKFNFTDQLSKRQMSPLLQTSISMVENQKYRDAQFTLEGTDIQYQLCNRLHICSKFHNLLHRFSSM